MDMDTHIESDNSDGATGNASEKKRAVGQASSQPFRSSCPLLTNCNPSVIFVELERSNVTRLHRRAQTAVDLTKVWLAFVLPVRVDERW